MATKTKSRKKSVSKKATRKTAARKSTSRKKIATRKKRATKKGADPKLHGWITHTEFASSDPDALKTWCRSVLGWTIKPGVAMPDGSTYILFMYSDKGGGGIRPTGPGEPAGAVPYVQVADVHKTFAKALRDGASQMVAPEHIMDDLVIAVVRAPGGVVIGFAGEK